MRAPTYDEFERNPKIVTRYLAELETVPLEKMTPGMLRFGSDMLFKAAESKLVSQIGHDRIAAQSEGVEDKQTFLQEAVLFETFGRILRGMANDRERAEAAAVESQLGPGE